MRSAVLSILFWGWQILGNLQVWAQSPAASLPVNIPVPSALDSVRPAIAVRGEPFGVIVIEVPIPPDLQAQNPRILVEDSSGRIFYPAISVREVELSAPREPVRPLGRGAIVDRLRNVIRGATERPKVPVAVTVAALFRGDQAVDIHLVGDIDQHIKVPVVSYANRAHQQAMEQWWKIYTHAARQSIADGDHPLLVQKYLCNMLARRLHLPPVDISRTPQENKEALAEPLGTLALLSAIEPLRDEILDQVLVQQHVETKAHLPLPPEPTWAPARIPPFAQDIPIESIAMRVPPECFYLRFGSFANYIWFRDISSTHGGDMAQMLLMRGFNYETSARMERMLNTKMTVLAKLFGDQVISDMAVIGRDLYMKEGASLGVLLSSKNAGLLVSSLEAERQKSSRQIAGASLQNLEIAGRKVTLLSTPDNRVRAFLATDQNYVLLTTSRAIVERFFEVHENSQSLGNTEAFRAARAWMPEANGYSVFVYLSPEFFHGLVAPQYQIELRRRLEAIAHLELAEAAMQAARGEQMAKRDIESLVQTGLLPPSFDERADGSRSLISGDVFIDSARGARGSFLPIADAVVTGVTESERERYAKLAEFYQRKWQQMDPMMFGLRRYKSTVNENCERVALEGYVAPMGTAKYGWLANLLGPPTHIEIKLPGDDIATVQAHMRGSISGRVADYHLFTGIKDMVPPEPGETKGLIKTLRFLKSVPAYLGAWPMPGWLDTLPLGLRGGRSGPDGLSRLLLGLWRWQGNDISLLSFDRTIIEHAAGSVLPTESPDAAQVRARVGDLSGSQLAEWINAHWYRRAWQASQGNARLLDSIHQQFKVSGNEAFEAAEKLLDVRLQCPLGGEYTFSTTVNSQEVGWWTSTAWSQATVSSSGNLVPPTNYSAPWLNWFRGGQVHVTQWPERLALVGTFDLQFPDAPNENSPALPSMNFDLFQLPLKLFGGEQQKEQPVQRKSF